MVVVGTEDGRRHTLRGRYARMVLWILALVPRLDGHRTGVLELHYTGDSVGAKSCEGFAPDWLEKHASPPA